MSYYLFDIAAAAVLLIAAWRGYRRGLILTLCGFLALFVALIGASAVSNALSGPASEALRPVIQTSLDNALSSYAAQLPPAADGSAAPGDGEVPIPLQDALDALQDSPVYRGFISSIQEAVDAGMVSAAADAVLVIADYVAAQLSRVALFLVSFILLLVLWYFISHALDLAFRLPVLSTLNHWGGAALGLAKGCLLVFVACWLLKGSFLPQQAIQSTYLLHFFCTASPLTLLS